MNPILILSTWLEVPKSEVRENSQDALDIWDYLQSTKFRVVHSKKLLIIDWHMLISFYF